MCPTSDLYRLPTPTTLGHLPEMALLDVLDHALGVAMNALVAANPELHSGDFLLEVPGPSVEACLADAVLTHLDALQTALERYRTYVLCHDTRRNACTDIDF